MPRIYKEHTGPLPYRRSRLRLILADDHKILRRGLRAILDAEPDLEVLGEASNVEDAVALARCVQPDVVITDVSFQNGSGIHTIGALHRECPGVRVVLLTGDRSPEAQRAARRAGAHAYIVKDSPVEVLLEAIRSEQPDPEHSDADHPAARAPAMLPGRRAADPGTATAIAEMTPRERQVLIGVAMGYSTKRIAGNIGRSVKTIEKHRFAMMHKLGLHNAAAATRYAIDHGLLDAGKEAQD